MATTTYFEYVIDPSTGQQIEVRDRYAREQLVHKVEKTIVNSLPAKPSEKQRWLEMEPFLYYVPIDGQDNEYQVWTLFFTGDPNVASDYTDPDNYEWAQVADTDADLSNFSTKGHTHEVISDVSVEDHEFTPKGTVVAEFSGIVGSTGQSGAHTHSFTPEGDVESTFTGIEGDTSQNGSHKHSFTPSGDVTSTFEGTSGKTDNGGTHKHNVTKTQKVLATKELNVTPATAVDFTNSSMAQRATGSLTSLEQYNASKAVFNGIDVQDGVLSFVTKQMATASTVSSLSATVDASKVTLDNSGTVSGQNLATGALVESEGGRNLVLTDVSVQNDGEHFHNFTPDGEVDSTFVGTSDDTGFGGLHRHTYTPDGEVDSTFEGDTIDTESAGSHTHSFSPYGNINTSFQGVKTVLKHKVDNGKVRTSPDTEDEGSHVFDWYGILFDEAEMDPHKTRVGNMDMHKTLPIQTKMRRCVLNDDGTVNYYLDDNDSTKIAGAQEGWTTEDETSMSRVETDDIRDSNEMVEAVKGNGIAWNQILPIPEIDISGTKNNVTLVDNRDGSYTVSTTNEGSNANTFFVVSELSQKIVVGHKYLVTGVSDKVGLCDSYYGSGTGFRRDNTTDYFAVPQTIGEKTNMSVTVLPGTTITTPITVSFNIIDLTILGIDNFTTVDEAKAWLADNVGTRDYYPYDAGSILNNTMEGVKTTFDGGSNTYPFDVTKVYNVDVEDFSVVQVFPDGMKRVFDVCDTLNANTAVSRIGRIVFTGDEIWNSADLGNGVISFGISNGVGYPTTGISNLYVYNNTTYEVGQFNLSWKQIKWMNFYESISKYPTVNDWKQHLRALYANGTPLIIEYKKSDDDTTTYTNLIYSDEGIDTPLSEKFFVDGILVGKGGKVEIIPPMESGEPDMMAAPTLTMKKYVLQAGATLDGTDGQVMVEYPEHWRKVYRYLDGAKSMLKAMISPYPQNTTGWVHVKKGYISAYEASIIDNKLCSVSDIKDLELSVVNGKPNASCDVSTIGETGKPADWAAYIAGEHSQLPTSNVTMDALRTAARARGNVGEYKWNMLVYEQYLAIYWLFVIEYANLNSQEAFTTALSAEGFHQGGLGVGATTIDSTIWGNFNSSSPFIPCGVTNCLGNHSGEVMFDLPSALGTSLKIAVNSYRGIELPFGHAWKFVDGIKYLGDGTQQAVLRCDNPENYSSEASSANYESIGNNVGNNGYKTKIMVGDDGDINCSSIQGGSANKAYCDYNAQAHQSETYYCCRVGGVGYIGPYSGLACLRSNFAIVSADAGANSRLSHFEK